MDYLAILSAEPVLHELIYDQDFVIRYALSVGAGEAPDELQFIWEDGLRTLPSLPVMMVHGAGEIIQRGGIDFAMMVHGEQRLAIHRPLPPAGRVRISSRCIGVADKGRDKGAIVSIESTVGDAGSGETFAVGTMSLFCRGDGGCGGTTDGPQPLPAVPARPWDHEIALRTLPQQAALYRLNGDRSPLHIDPRAALAAGFARPILHGLCTYAFACRAVMVAAADNDPARIAQFDARLSAPVYPGETITTRIWRDGRRIAFEAVIAERGAVVIRNGLCLLRE